MVILEDALAPIAVLAERAKGEGHDPSEDDAVVRYYPRPRLGPDAYAVMLFHGLAAEDVARYEALHAVRIPQAYATLLKQMNGAHLYEISLFGLPPTTLLDPPRLDRMGTREQPHDLASNGINMAALCGVPNDWFCFGSGPWSHSERVHYFFTSDGQVASYRAKGISVRWWDRFSTFLAEEIQRAEACYPEYEEFMAGLMREAKRPWWKLWG